LGMVLPQFNLERRSAGSHAAFGTTAALCRRRLRLLRTNEPAREAAVDFGRQTVQVDSALDQERACVLDVVDTPQFELDVREASRLEFRDVFIVAECAGDAADPQFHAAADVGRTSPRTITSDTANRPPGFNTRNASRSTASLSLERLMTQFEMMTSIELSGKGIASIVPLRNSTFLAPAFR
jgi:hypothetical protein